MVMHLSQISGECICLGFIFYAAFLDRYASFATPTFVCFSARAKDKGGEFLQISVTVSLFVPICIVLNVGCYYLLVGNPTLCCVKVSKCCISDRSSSDHVKKLNYSKVVKCNCRSYKCNRLWCWHLRWVRTVFINLSIPSLLVHIHSLCHG